jgi:hypothetical protein
MAVPAFIRLSLYLFSTLNARAGIYNGLAVPRQVITRLSTILNGPLVMSIRNLAYCGLTKFFARSSKSNGRRTIGDRKLNLSKQRSSMTLNRNTFQAFSDTEVLVLGSNGNLWLERGPFGKVPPPRA